MENDLTEDSPAIFREIARVVVLKTLSLNNLPFCLSLRKGCRHGHQSHGTPQRGWDSFAFLDLATWRLGPHQRRRLEPVRSTDEHTEAHGKATGPVHSVQKGRVQKRLWSREASYTNDRLNTGGIQLYYCIYSSHLWPKVFLKSQRLNTHHSIHGPPKQPITQVSQPSSKKMPPWPPVGGRLGVSEIFLWSNWLMFFRLERSWFRTNQTWQRVIEISAGPFLVLWFLRSCISKNRR